ncbi:hypothetical protein AB0E69_21755 [Kribbella sp. NPDC026611]|uniref:hypothetical protein n=1 Tax=Kribbella sp. NPDC026611 TaxID=3154911 RepID=UPI0033D742E0
MTEAAPENVSTRQARRIAGRDAQQFPNGPDQAPERPRTLSPEAVASISAGGPAGRSAGTALADDPAFLAGMPAPGKVRSVGDNTGARGSTTGPANRGTDKRGPGNTGPSHSGR